MLSEMETESGESSSIGGQNEGMELPLGYRFDPHPMELIYYVKVKNFDLPLTIEIPEVDLYEYHPRRLAEEYLDRRINNNGRFYYFTKRKRRNQKGLRIKRSTNEGYWKSISKDKDIKDHKNKKIGHYRTLKFIDGKDQRPTHWNMHEFRDLNTKSVMNASSATEISTRIDEHYVLCMIYETGKICPTNHPPATQAIMNMVVDATEVGESSIPQNQSMFHPSHPHDEAKTLMPNIDRFQQQTYFGNFNEFSVSQESLDDVTRYLTEPDREQMHLDFPNPNPNFQQQSYFGNYEFSVSQESLDDITMYLTEPEGE